MSYIKLRCLHVSALVQLFNSVTMLVIYIKN